MNWLLYLPAIVSPIAVVAAYWLLKVSAKRLHERIPETVPAHPREAPPATFGGDVVVDGEHGGTINVTFHRENA
jgi:hypothetical protein